MFEVTVQASEGEDWSEIPILLLNKKVFRMEAPGVDLKQDPGKGPKLLWANTST